jgi:hypothetical protein
MSKIELLPFHPLSNLLPLMEGQEFEDLVTDIRHNGLKFAIATFDGKIIDGRNRALACQRANRRPIYDEYTDFAFPDEARLRAFIISANIRRRHLTAEQKRDLIAALLKAEPEKSDRQIAQTVQASPTTVGAVRAKLETAGDVSKLDTRTDAKGRSQPASKPKPAWKPPTPMNAEAQAAAIKAMTVSARSIFAKPDQELVALRDFAKFTLLNTDNGKLKLGGDAECIRRWRDLKARVESVLKMPA